MYEFNTGMFSLWRACASVGPSNLGLTLAWHPLSTIQEQPEWWVSTSNDVIQPSMLDLLSLDNLENTRITWGPWGFHMQKTHGMVWLNHPTKFLLLDAVRMQPGGVLTKNPTASTIPSKENSPSETPWPFVWGKNATVAAEIPRISTTENLWFS